MSSIRPRRRAGQRPAADDWTDPAPDRVGSEGESQMKLGPRPTGRPWTPADDAQLLALLASGLDRPSIARKLKRSVHAIASRQAGLDFRAGAEGEGKIAAMAHGNPWTPEEDNRLRMLLGAGKPIEIVSAELKRSAKAVAGRAYILRISLKRVKLKPKAKGK